MTEKHPLTEEMMDKIHGDEPGYSNPYDEDDMRSAADWQLEQVIRWIEYNLGPHYIRPEGCPHRPAIGYVLLTEDVVENLKEAMRPTTQEGN